MMVLQKYVIVLIIMLILTIHSDIQVQQPVTGMYITYSPRLIYRNLTKIGQK